MNIPITISFQSLSCHLQDRKLLNNLNGTFGVGMNAIMGGSGAGKTTLLNIISKKLENQRKIKVSGKLLANGEEYDIQKLQTFSRFVMQNDILLSTMTVKECLSFSADMRLVVPQEYRNAAVERIISTFMLGSCANTLVGDVMTKGISGGERKRCCIGVELIGDPKVIFLDEPTSGLDSFTAFKIMKILQLYGIERQRTLIFTIHQPSSDIWQLFDSLTLLAEGQFLYHGKQQNVVPYFASLGFRCPQFTNPADYLISLSSNLNKMPIELQIDNQDNHNQIFDFRQNLQNMKSPVRPTFGYQLKRLMKRQLLNIGRNRILLKARIIQSLIMNTFMGLVYRNLDMNDTFQICKTLYLMALGMFYQGLNLQTLTFCVEREVFLKEESSQMYSALAYYLAKILPEFLVSSYFGFQLIAITFWMIGFDGGADKFFFMALNYALICNSGNALGVMGSSLFEDQKVAVGLGPLFLFPLILFSGIYKNIGDLQEWIKWIRFIIPTFYLTNNLSQDQAHNNDTVGLNFTFDKWKGTFIIFVFYIVFNLIAFSLLVFKRKKLQ